MRDIYVAIESLRNSMDLIERFIAEWIGLSIDFVDDLTDEEVGQLLHLWKSLSVPEETAEVLAKTLQLRCEGGRLQVAASCSPRPDTVEVVRCALLEAWKFVKFTESRFMTAGAAARPLIVALLTGVESLVAFISIESEHLIYLN